MASNPYPSQAFYLACADGRKALAKDATESAIGAPQMRTESRARTTAVGDLIEAPNGTSGRRHPGVQGDFDAAGHMTFGGAFLECYVRVFWSRTVKKAK